MERKGIKERKRGQLNRTVERKKERKKERKRLNLENINYENKND